MNIDPVDYEDEETSTPLVHWYPRGGPLRAISPDVVAIAGLALGVFATAALAVGAVGIARRAFGGGALRELEVDRLVVGKLEILDR